MMRSPREELTATDPRNEFEYHAGVFVALTDGLYPHGYKVRAMYPIYGLGKSGATRFADIVIFDNHQARMVIELKLWAKDYEKGLDQAKRYSYGLQGPAAGGNKKVRYGCLCARPEGEGHVAPLGSVLQVVMEMLPLLDIGLRVDIEERGQFKFPSRLLTAMHYATTTQNFNVPDSLWDGREISSWIHKMSTEGDPEEISKVYEEKLRGIAKTLSPYIDPAKPHHWKENPA